MEHDFRERFGRYLEEFEVGDVYKHWPGKTINEHDNDLFCLMTMNHMPLHIDLNYAQQSSYMANSSAVACFPLVWFNSSSLNSPRLSISARRMVTSFSSANRRCINSGSTPKGRKRWMR